eukprot:2421449-Pyramimonas_sp.AAC.1
MSLKAASSKDDSCVARVREWPLVVAALGALESRAFHDTSAKHDDAAAFDSLQPSQMTLSLSDMIFKILSRQGALFSDLAMVRSRCLSACPCRWLMRTMQCANSRKPSWAISASTPWIA